MDLFIHQVFSGLATGGIYASVALALVMIYQATHLVNFAQGGVTYRVSVDQADGLLRGHIHPRQTYFCMFSSKKANTSGSQMFTPRWMKSCPSSTVWPMGG